MEGWEGRKAKKRRIEGVQEKKKNQGLAGMENGRSEKVRVEENNKVAMD